MTLEDMIKKVLALIEELNPLSEVLTDDPDIALKIREVINQVMFELCRYKKIPQYVEVPVSDGQLVTFEQLGDICGYEIYQINRVKGVRYEAKANGTVMKMKESGTAEIDLFVYPERITDKTSLKGYEFSLSSDVLEVMPYGVAADLLKSDVSADYGNMYSVRFREMMDRLDHRYQMPGYTIVGGVDV
jgi:hypothetical protein